MRVFLLLYSVARAECPPIDDRELKPLLELELGSRAPLLIIECRDGRTQLRLGALERSLDLASTAPNARPRVVALAASELMFREPPLPPPATKHRNRSEAAMWKHVFAASIAIVPVVAASPKPEARVIVEGVARAPVLPPKKAEPPAPELRAEDVFNRVGDQVHAVNEAQKRLLEKLIEQSSGDEKADYLVRRGDLDVEEQRYHRFRARTLDQRIFEAERSSKKAEAASLRAIQEDEGKREQAATLAAVKRYLEVANGPYGDYKKMDEVLFDLGRLLREVGRADAARGFWKRLVKDHPTSRYVPDGLLAFGDDAFERRDLENALAFYEKVLSYSESPLAEYARYKIGWCDYNLARWKDALDAFLTVIDHAKGKNDRLALLREARKDLVRTYAQIGTPERAWPFFQRAGGDAAMLQQLAELYNQQGKFGDSIRVYRQLMALQPNSPKLCAWQGEVVKNTLALGGSRAEPESVRELQRLSSLQSRGDSERSDGKSERSDGKSERSDGKSERSDGKIECRENTANLLRELAMVWHQEAQRTQQLPTYERAGALYKEYLKSFPKSPDVPKMTFYYAELLYKLEHFCDAAPLYSEVVKNQPQRREEAAYAAVLSWRSCLKLDDKPPATEGGKRSEANAARGSAEPVARPTDPQRRVIAPRAIPDAWQKMIAAFDFYLKYVPNSPERVRVQYNEGVAYYEFDHCAEAIPIFRDIARKSPASDLAPYAADLLFDCDAQKGDKEQLRADVGELCSQPALTTPRPDFAKRCVVIHTALMRDRAETMEAAHRYKEAADLYRQMAADHPDDPRVDEILYDSAIDYQRANLVGLSILAFNELTQARPDSPLAKKATYMVGRSYQNIAAFEAAADNYEKFAARWPGERDAPTALYRAAFLRRGLGDNARAADDASQFFQRYGNRADLTDTAASLVFGQAQIFEQQRDWTRLGDHLEKYLRDYGARGGVDRQIIAHVKLGELAWRASCPVTPIGGSCIERRRDRAKLPESCGGPVKLTVHARRPDLVQKADRQFIAALQLLPALKHLKDEARLGEAQYYAAEAKMLQADVEFERFLSLQLPASQKKLAGWFADKTRELDQARAKYESVILMKQAHWAIAAAARVGQMFQTFAAQLNASPVPPAPPPPRGVAVKLWRDDFKNAFCNQLSAHVVKLEDKAEDALRMCLGKSTSLSWFNEWSSLCEAELQQLHPHDVSAMVELRAEPHFVSVVPERAPPQR